MIPPSVPSRFPIIPTGGAVNLKPTRDLGFGRARISSRRTYE